MLYCCFSHIRLHMWEDARHVRCNLLVWVWVAEGMCGGSPLYRICWHVSSCYQIQWGIGDAVNQGRCRNPLTLFGTMTFVCWLCCVSPLCCLMVPMGWLNSWRVRWSRPTPTFLGCLLLGKGGWVWAMSVEVMCPTYTLVSKGLRLPILIGSVLWMCVSLVQQHSFDARWEALVDIVPAILQWWLSCIQHWLSCQKFVCLPCGPCR